MWGSFLLAKDIDINMDIQPFLLLILYMAIFNIKKCHHVKVIQCTRGCFGYWPRSHDFQNYLRKSNGMHPAMTKWQNHSVCKAFLDFFNSISKGLHLSRKLSWPKVNLRKPARLPPGLSQISLPRGTRCGTISRRLSLHNAFASLTSVLERALVLNQLQFSAAPLPLMRT